MKSVKFKADIVLDRRKNVFNNCKSSPATVDY